MFKAIASGFNFAHLTGLSRAPKAGGEDLREQDQTVAAAAAAEEDEDMEEDAETSEGEKDANKGGKKSGKKGAKNKDKAGEEDEDEDEDENSGEEDGDEDEEEETSDGGAGKGGKKAAKPMHKTDAASFKKGRKAERRRVGLILSNPAAAGNIGLAVKLAVNTGMSSAAAVTLLEATPAQRGGGLDSRMSGAKVPDLKAAAPKLEGPAAVDASWDHAMKDFKPAR